MHIPEGYLPVSHAVAWSATAAPFVVHGAVTLNRRLKDSPEDRLLLGASGAFVADLTTYCVTSVQLAPAFPDAESGVAGALAKFGGIFAVTQIPLAISEGLLTVLVVRLLRTSAAGDLIRLGVLRPAPAKAAA